MLIEHPIIYGPNNSVTGDMSVINGIVNSPLKISCDGYATITADMCVTHHMLANAIPDITKACDGYLGSSVNIPTLQQFTGNFILPVSPILTENTQLIESDHSFIMTYSSNDTDITITLPDPTLMNGGFMTIIDTHFDATHNVFIVAPNGGLINNYEYRLASASFVSIDGRWWAY